MHAYLFPGTEEGPKTLAEVAKACADKEGPDTPGTSPEKQHMTLAEAADVYQKMTPCKQLEEVEVVTGEEKERNVIQVSKNQWTNFLPCSLVY